MKKLYMAPKSENVQLDPVMQDFSNFNPASVAGAVDEYYYDR